MVDGGSEFQGAFGHLVKKFFDIDVLISRNSARFVERLNFTLRRMFDDRVPGIASSPLCLRSTTKPSTLPP